MDGAGIGVEGEGENGGEDCSMLAHQVCFFQTG